MARINWQGHEFRATPVKQLPNGSWLMEAREQAPRVDIGTRIEITSAEIVAFEVGEREFNGPGAVTTPSATVSEPAAVAILATAPAQPAGTAPMAAPETHFRDLVTGLRADVRASVADAKLLVGRKNKSLVAFHLAQDSLHGLLNEVDAATAEINGALLPEGSNGGNS